MKFWNDVVAEKSYEVLRMLRRNYDFILIGGWAVYLYTRNAKSKDIDIIIDYGMLDKMRNNIPLKKNDRLRRYETKIEGISIDIYLPYYSTLVIPPEEIENDVRIVEGFRVPSPEILLALKQQAELERKDSIKGFKDRIDILGLLELVDLEKYTTIVPKEYLDRLKGIVLSARDEYAYLGYRNPREVKLLKKRLAEMIDSVVNKQKETEGGMEFDM